MGAGYSTSCSLSIVEESDESQRRRRDAHTPAMQRANVKFIRLGEEKRARDAAIDLSLGE
jgi:hypothetical protein